MKKAILSVILGATMLVSPVITTVSASAATNNVTVLDLSNEDGVILKDEYLEAGSKNTYTFTIPKTGLYVMCTSGGVVDSYGTLTAVDEDGTVTKYENDDHGDNVNFYLRVYLNEGAKCTLEVSGYGEEMYGEYKLIVNEYK